MTNYVRNQPQQMYPANTSNFSNYYSHRSPNNGYYYKYFVTTDLKKFLYLAFPISLACGTKAYFVDESNRIFEATVSELDIEKLRMLERILWDKGGIKRIPIQGLEWQKKIGQILP